MVVLLRQWESYKSILSQWRNRNRLCTTMKLENRWNRTLLGILGKTVTHASQIIAFNEKGCLRL